MMAYLINNARSKKRSAILTLLDLINTFGEAHHNFIASATDYHNVPQAIQYLATNLYTDFIPISFLTAFLLQVLLLNVECFKGIALVPYYSTYALTHAYNSLNKKNTNNWLYRP